jgi:hypothetical protein
VRRFFRQRARAFMKVLLLAGVSALALTAAFGSAVWAAKTRREIACELPKAPVEAVHTARATRNFLLYFVIPVWIAAGLADWLCHRATDIERTAGPAESLLHLLVLAKSASPRSPAYSWRSPRPCSR